MAGDKEVIVQLDKILPYLFQDAKLESPYGLSYAHNDNDGIQMGKHITEIIPLLNLLPNGKKELSGGLISIFGFKYVVLLPSSRSPIVDGKLDIPVPNDVFKQWLNLGLAWHHLKMDFAFPYKREKFIGVTINIQFD